MSDQARIDKAIKWLSEQGELLKSLRNASTRDPDFKQWRQTTLTYIQRIWPGDAKRSGRFRRVPFSPPSSQADRHELRLAYEKGHAEAVKLIALLLEDIQENGLPEGEGNGRPPALENVGAQDDFPDMDSLELPDDESPEKRNEKPDRPRSRNGRKRQTRKKSGVRKRLKDMLGFTDPPLSSDEESDTSWPLEYPVEEVTAIEHDDPSPAPQPSSEQAAEPIEVPAAEATTEPIEPADPIESPEPAEPIAAPEQTEEPEPIESTEAPSAPDLMPDEPVVVEEQVVAKEEVAAPPADEGTVDNPAPEEAEHQTDFGEFLNASPVFQSVNRGRRPAVQPVEVAPAETPVVPVAAQPVAAPVARTYKSAVAVAVSALAGDVQRLGVPEAQENRVRTTLLDLADLLDEDDLSWDGLRGAVDFAMEHPAVARRVLPLLIPYLDRAA